MNNIRQQGLSALQTITNNASLIEEKIYSMSSSRKDYLNNVYDAIYTIQSSHNKKKIVTDILQHFMLGKNHTQYNSVREYIQQDNYTLSTPLEIEEGVLECKCGSKKTISCQRQTRSADEGMTTFAQCIECGNRWRHNN
jgi:DNA-directed RNA polymerase subunit M/transcription elongation factor TFIIS